MTDNGRVAGESQDKKPFLRLTTLAHLPIFLRPAFDVGLLVLNGVFLTSQVDDFPEVVISCVRIA